MKQYEMLCILPGTLSEEEIKPVVASVQEILGKHDATDVSVQDMGKSRLAYPIKHIRYGYFQLVRFSIEPTNLAKAERDVRLLGTLLRLVVTAGTTASAENLTLASDPTALSAPKRESRRDEKPRRRAPRGDDAHDEETQKTDEPSEKEAVDANIATDETISEKAVSEEAPVSTEQVKAEEISMEDIDKKLDQVLQDDMDKV